MINRLPGGLFLKTILGTVFYSIVNFKNFIARLLYYLTLFFSVVRSRRAIQLDSSTLDIPLNQQSLALLSAQQSSQFSSANNLTFSKTNLRRRIQPAAQSKNYSIISNPNRELSQRKSSLARLTYLSFCLMKPTS